MKLYIKHMVCVRCKMIVKSELDKLGLNYAMLEMGEIEISDSITDEQKKQFNDSLLKLGLEVVDDKKTILIEKIKNTIIDLIQYSDEDIKINFSHFISQKVNYDYNYLSVLFSEVQGVTIEKYIISQKIERVKELLVYEDMPLSEIAIKLHYSSVAHLSSQFKKQTGLTPSHFKEIRQKKS